MRKSKFVSILTSLAMTGSMALSAISFTATAADANPVGLELVSEKTSFTLDEVEAGNASATVYVDVTTEFAASENVSFIEFELWPSEWGTIDPVNLEFCNPNVLGTDKGYKTNAFVAQATTTGSLWTKDMPTRAGYSIYNFADALEGFVYGDLYPPKACLMTSSNTGKLRTGGTDAGEHLCQFDIEIPADAEAGTYTINFKKAYAGIGVIDQEGDNMEMVPITNVNTLSITIGDDSSSTDPTDPSDSTDPSEGDGDDFLLGDANLDGKVNVRDCAAIASALAKGKAADLPQKNADYNQDGKVNVRDAAALAADLAKGTVKS